MSQINNYPSEPRDTQGLFLLAIKQSLKTARYLWPLIILFTVCTQLTQLTSGVSDEIAKLILSVFYMLVGYLLLNAMLCRGHQSYSNAQGWSLPPLRYWLNLISIFLCFLIPACAWNYWVLHSDVSETVTLIWVLLLATVLVGSYLLTLFLYPLLAFQDLSFKQSLIASSYFVRQNWIRAGIIYTIFVFIVIISLPSSGHMIWLAQYHLNIPGALLIYFCLLPIAINFWLLITVDSQLRYPHVVSKGL